LYESVSFWDKEKKQSRNKRVCVGKLDPTSGELISSKLLVSAQEQAAPQALITTATAEIVGAEFQLFRKTLQFYQKNDKLRHVLVMLGCC
jgi:hypothetical protein